MNHSPSHKQLFAVTVVLAVTILCVQWIWPDKVQAAPNVTFRTLSGKTVDLQSFRGQPVLINFWATSCISCLEEIPHLIQLHKEFGQDGLALLAVAMSYDPPNRVLELTEGAKLPYEVSLDIDSEIAKSFGNVNLTPTTFLINPKGDIVLHTLGALDMPKLRERINSYL